MECWTTEPGMQLYTANGFNGKPVSETWWFLLRNTALPGLAESSRIPLGRHRARKGMAIGNPLSIQPCGLIHRHARYEVPLVLNEGGLEVFKRNRTSRLLFSINCGKR